MLVQSLRICSLIIAWRHCLSQWDSSAVDRTSKLRWLSSRGCLRNSKQLETDEAQVLEDTKSYVSILRRVKGVKSCAVFIAIAQSLNVICLPFEFKSPGLTLFIIIACCSDLHWAVHFQLTFCSCCFVGYYTSLNVRYAGDSAGRCCCGGNTGGRLKGGGVACLTRAASADSSRTGSQGRSLGALN